MSIKKYLSLYWTFFRTSLMADLEYRLNIVTQVITDLFWYAAQASVFEVIFTHAPNISGWTLPAARVFMAMMFFVDALWMILFQENFGRLSTKIRRGELDLLLVKPVNSMFMVTFMKQNTAYLVNLVFTGAYLVWTVSLLPTPVSGFRFLFLLSAIPSALMICYAFRMFFSVWSVIFANAESLNYVWYQLYKLGMRPDAMYPKWLRYLVLSFLPVAFIASVPTRLILEPPNWVLACGGPAIGLFLIWLCARVWNYALTYYSSASS